MNPATPEPRRQTVSIMKACEIASVSRRTIYNWIKAGRLEYTRTAGGSIRIFPESLFMRTPTAAAATTNAAAAPGHPVKTRLAVRRAALNDASSVRSDGVRAVS
jgi:excisionase family DNA binding protein